MFNKLFQTNLLLNVNNRLFLNEIIFYRTAMFKWTKMNTMLQYLGSPY